MIGKDIPPRMVLLGYAGGLGSGMIASIYGEELKAVYCGRYIDSLLAKYQKGQSLLMWRSPWYHARDREYARSPKEALALLEDRGGLVISLGRGGVLGGLYRFAKEWDLGFRLKIKAVRVLQVSVEICQYFGLNIYSLYTDAVLVCCRDTAETLDIVEGAGMAGSYVGDLTWERAKSIVDKERIESVNPVKTDEIQRVVPEIFALGEDGSMGMSGGLFF